MARLKENLSGLTPSALISKCTGIETKMSGNPLFPSPDPSIADLTTERKKLESLTTSANGGDREAIAKRNEQQKVVVSMLKRLGAYVSMMADESETAILSSGFEVRKKRTIIESLPQPKKLRATRASRQGVVQLRWKKVYHSHANIVEMTEDNPKEGSQVWVQVGVTTKCSYTIDTLEPGKYYWFRVQAFGTGRPSPHSMAIMIMAA
jgi:hypothetical protein